MVADKWGVPVPVVCKRRPERMEAIAEELSKGEHHIAVLEEIWLKSDFQLILERVCSVYPNSHYFYSGAIGSGVCVFSKLPIIETFFHVFHLNGHAYKIHHGDWFGGKGVGMCRLEFHGFKINLYVTHIHAEYNRSNDEYLPHRVAQAFEMSQFIRHTSQNCDVILAAGDFNLEVADIGYRVLTSNTPLSDAWEKKKNVPETNPTGGTCECPFNPFSDKALVAMWPDGKRIDYVMFHAKPGVKVIVDKCMTTMGKIPGAQFSYSDHEAVAAELSISHVSEVEGSSPNFEDHRERMQNLEAACDVINTGITEVRQRAVRWQLRALGIAVLLLWLFNSDIAHSNPPSITILLGFVKLALVVVVAAMVWLSVVVQTAEANGLVATKNDLQWILMQTKKKEE